MIIVRENLLNNPKLLWKKTVGDTLVFDRSLLYCDRESAAQSTLAIIDLDGY